MNYKTALPLAMLALAFSCLATASQAKSDCRTYKVTSAKMSSLSLKKAKQRARGAWERKTKRLSGIDTAWHDWANAIEREYKCYKKGNRHYCRAVGRPCPTYGKRVAPEMRCQGQPITGDTAKASSVKAAKKEARGKWERKAKANWGDARDHRYDCRQKGKHRWYCNGIARKCWKA